MLEIRSCKNKIKVFSERAIRRTPPSVDWHRIRDSVTHLLRELCSVARRGWGSWACSAWRREGWEGTFKMPLNIRRVGVRRTGPNSFQWWPATGQGATGTNWSLGSSSWTRGRTSSLWGWRSPGTGSPGSLWSLLLWRYSRPAWTRSCAACSGWPTEVPANPEHSVILWKSECGNEICWWQSQKPCQYRKLEYHKK